MVDIADVLGRLVDKSLVTADEGSSRARRYRLLETVRLYARERLEQADETASFAQRHAHWALTVAEQERSSPWLDREAANLRTALDTLLERAPGDALRLCVALGPFWLRRIDLHEAQRRFDAALAGIVERTALRADGLLAAAGIEFRRGTLAQAFAKAEESWAIASEIGDARAEWRALQFMGEFGIASDAAEVAMPWLQRALELARREGFAAAEAICVYSLGVAHWILGDLARAEEFLAQSLQLFGPLAGSPERVMSPVNIAEIRTSQPGGRPGLRVVFEDSLQPFVEISCDSAVSYILANHAGLVRARGDLVRARALLDQSAARFEDSGDEAGKAAVLVRRAYLELAEGALPRARDALQQALELQARTERPARPRAGARGARSDRHHRRRLPQRGAAPGRGSRHLPACRRSVGAIEHALANGRPGLCRGEHRRRGGRTAGGPRGAGRDQRERWIANTLAGLAEVAVLRGDVQRAAALFTDARDRYAARDDALGVADVERRLRDLAKDALSPGKVAPRRTPAPRNTKGKRR